MTGVLILVFLFLIVPIISFVIKRTNSKFYPPSLWRVFKSIGISVIAVFVFSIIFYTIQILGLGIGRSPGAVARSGDLIYVSDGGVRIASDCWCPYAGKRLFQSIIWVIGTAKWGIEGRIDKSDQSYNSKNQRLYSEEGKRFGRYDSPFGLSDKNGKSRSVTSTNDELLKLIKLTDKASSTAMFFETNDSILVFNYDVTWTGVGVSLHGADSVMPVRIQVVDKKSREVRTMFLDEDPFKQFQVDFYPSWQGGFWADEKYIIYTSERGSEGDKPGVFFAFDANTGKLISAFELDALRNKFLFPGAGYLIYIFLVVLFVNYQLIWKKKNIYDS